MLKGKSVVITGSTSGIGLGIARGFAQEGCNILLNGFGEPQQIERVRAGLEKEFGVAVRYSGADMARPAEIESMIEAADGLGGVDVLVNNAGIQHVAAVDEFPVEQWDRILA
ncbi:MAG: SDR family NAD(P)-dependent oxidoreductase, partial [Burkholderiales bacterium]